jgi:hypothetical protein
MNPLKHGKNGQVYRPTYNDGYREWDEEKTKPEKPTKAEEVMIKKILQHRKKWASK